MKFLVDNALSPSLAIKLEENGYDAIHVRDLGMAAAPDEEIFNWAAKKGRIILSADTDFGAILAFRRISKPSVVIFRQSNKKPESVASLFLENLPSIAEFLQKGHVIIFEDRRIRVRKLPIVTAFCSKVTKQ